MIAVCFGFALSPTVTALADDEREGEDRPASYESRIYGTVEKMPPERVGLWVVGRRDIIVTKETKIVERHGKVEVGAYVEVKGNNTGRRFSASRMEVKRSKMK
ncbi:MAG TPA: DUF5666 domain-containing protein [Geobacteraceae bacterium]